MINRMPTPYLILLVLISATACQPSEAQQQIGEEVNSDLKQKQSEQAALSKNSKSTAKYAMAETAVSNNKGKADCDSLRDMMSQVGRGSKIEEIYRIQQVLSVCLPQTNHETALVLLKDYDAMYNRFLEEGLKTEDEVNLLNDLAYELENGGLTSKASFATLNPHLQYLLK